MKLYLYCLAELAVAVQDELIGIECKQVNMLEHEGLWVWSSEFQDDVVRVSHENISKHESIIRAVLEGTTPLPFRFGTVVTKEQLQSYLTARNDLLKSSLAHVRGAVEMSVKIIWNRKVEDLSNDHLAEPIGQGVSFLLEKKRELLGSERLQKGAEDIKAWLHLQVKDLVREEIVTLRPSARLVLAASHLVERDVVSRYIFCLRTAMTERPELHFLFSGPWAPYSFANIAA